MITIIKKGSKMYMETCKNCGCVFKFNAEDITRRTAWDDHGGHYPVCDFYEIDCPTCSYTIDLGHHKDIDFQNEAHKMKHIDD